MPALTDVLAAEQLLSMGIGDAVVEPFPNPAPGADVNVLPIGGFLRVVWSFRARLVASAVVASRAVVLRVTDGTTTVADLPPGSSVSANGDMGINFLPGLGAFFSGTSPGAIAAPAPPLVLLPGWRLQTVTAAIDVADQFSEVTLWCLRVPLSDLKRWWVEELWQESEEG